MDHMVIFNERHLRRVLSSYVGYYQGTRTLFGSTRIAPTHARLCHARSERWSLYRKSAACIIGTNVPPPDSYRIPALQWLRHFGTPSPDDLCIAALCFSPRVPPVSHSDCSASRVIESVGNPFCHPLIS